MKTLNCFMFALLVSMFATSCGTDPRDKYALGERVTVVAPDAGVAPVADAGQPPPAAVGGKPFGAACMADAECEDANPCTTISCLHGKCDVPVVKTCQAGYVCSPANAECVQIQQDCDKVDDGDPCTHDSCNFQTGKAEHVKKDCDDKDDNTDDSCNSATGDCDHHLTCGNCNDDDPCTHDFCDPATAKCSSTPVECPSGYSCLKGTCEQDCSENGDCNDGNWCTLDSCNEVFGNCEHKDRDCADQDSSTIDVCVGQPGNMGSCESFPTACTGGCADTDPCTDDFCQNAECLHIDAATTCGLGTQINKTTCHCDPIVIKPECTVDADCNDSDACTADNCEAGKCVNTKKTCPAGQLCDPQNGQCKLLDQCQEDCADKNPCTVDVCLNGECKNILPTCAAGEFFNQDTCLCEVIKPECTVDADCNDSDACTADNCEAGKCVNTKKTCPAGQLCDPQNGQCKLLDQCQEDCADANKCTTDVCLDGQCKNILPKCVVGTMFNMNTCVCDVIPPECLLDADCDDSNGCTTDECAANVCIHTVKTCAAGTLCDSKSGACKVLDKCPNGCESKDPCTPSICQSGICVPVPPKCGAGTAVNPATCQCEIVKQCSKEGLKSCDVIKLNGVAVNVWTICSNGIQTNISICGLVTDKAACMEGVGCSNGKQSSPPPATNPTPAGTLIGLMPTKAGEVFCWGQAKQFMGKYLVQAGKAFTCPSGSLSLVVNDQPLCGGCLVDGLDAGICHVLNPGPGFGCQL